MDDMTQGVLIGMTAALIIVGATALVLARVAEKLLIGPHKAPQAPKEVSSAGYARGGVTVSTEQYKPDDVLGAQFAYDLAATDPIPASLRDLDDDVSIEDRLAMLRGEPVDYDEDDEEDDGTITFTDEEVDEPEDVPTQRRAAGKGKTLFLSDDGRVLDPETGQEVGTV